MRRIALTTITILSLFFCITSFAKTQQSFRQWLVGFKEQAVSEGINPQFFDQVFKGMKIGHRQIHFDRTQPEKRITFLQYRNKRVDKHRIYLGRKAMKKNGALLNQIGREYGVDPCVIASIWGMETAYGNYMGNFNVIRSLATLAFEGRREAFFRKELVIALHILQDGHVTMDKFKGEWAGGSGHSQFLPSSWKNYAVDYTGDGHKDIWTNKADAFASMANYLQANGWDYGEPTRVEVTLPRGFDKDLLSYKIEKPVSAWAQMGVRPASGWHFPKHNITASIVKPYGGPAIMVFNNWRVIMRYNNSTFYAGAITYLADKICQRPLGS